ncbi:hypothetical protein BKA62DRAFT_721519 [Auriculariales sp. MPI-PUGE-AT-0066]|nr:hypothetical protein BKA62DRAFT_721519 [Auriculariales sp. MPI-PUGE-AT-0066]
MLHVRDATAVILLALLFIRTSHSLPGISNEQVLLSGAREAPAPARCGYTSCPWRTTDGLSLQFKEEASGRTSCTYEEDTACEYNSKTGLAIEGSDSNCRSKCTRDPTCAESCPYPTCPLKAQDGQSLQYVGDRNMDGELQIVCRYSEDLVCYYDPKNGDSVERYDDARDYMCPWSTEYDPVCHSAAER